MRKTTLLALAALLGSTGRTLAQNTPEENNPNIDAPFVRNIRADRPGQTITAQVLRAGQFQIETGLQRTLGGAATGADQAALRIGFFNSMELRVSQAYARPGLATRSETGRSEAGGWAPVVVGAKLMLSPNYDTRTQVALLVESAVPRSGGEGLRTSTWGPSGRLLLSQQVGERFGLEANLGFKQQDLTVKAIESGEFLGSIALNGALGDRAGFLVETYGSGRKALSMGATAGLYWRPVAALRLDVNAGRALNGPVAGRSILGAGLVVRLGK